MLNKRGVSAIVATVLIIMITVAAVAILWAFVIPMIKDSSNDSTSEKVQLSIETDGGYTTWDEVQGIARVQIKRGNDNVNLTALDFTFVRKGNSVSQNKSDVPRKGETLIYSFDLKSFGKPEKVSVAPITSEGIGNSVSENVNLLNYTGGGSPYIFRWYYDADCDGYGNGNYVDNETRPNFRCLNTTSEVSTISIIDCNDTNFSVNAGAGNCPTTPQTCTSFTYNSWSSCNNGYQTTTVASQSPSGCIGGNPILIRSCTPASTCNSYSVSNGAFVLCTCSDLQNMSANLSASYVLGQDIDCTATRDGSSIWDSSGFNPIGPNGYTFTGNFDGQKHTVSNLFINRPTTDYVGLFGVVWNNVNIQSVNLVNVNISGKIVVGGLAGHQQSSSLITQVSSSGIVRGSSKVGGLVGYSVGTILNSYSSANVTGSGDYDGGLVGWLTAGSINNSYATGNVFGGVGVGGLLGWQENNGRVTDCFSTGDVTRTGPLWSGGLVGRKVSGTILNSFWNSKSTNPSLCYDSGSVGCTAISNNESYFYSKSNAPLSSWDFTNVWQENAGSYPTLK